MAGVHEVQGLAVALGIGLLVGAERERRKGEGPGRGVAGLRTFALVALAGAVAALVGGVAVAVAGAFVALAAAASWRWTRDRDPGLTTEVALLVVFLLGVLAMREAALAAGIGVAVTLLLAGKSRLHRWVRGVLSEEELHDALLLAAGAAIVLPLLPDRPVDPWRVLNPQKLWLLALLVMALNAAGHLALRAFGARVGLMLTGLAGGFVSSTATIGAMGTQARAQPALAGPCATAALLSNVSTAVQLAVVLGAVSPALLRALAMPLVASGTVVLAIAAAAGWRARAATPTEASALPGHAFAPRHVLLFVGLVALVTLAAGAALAGLGSGALVPTLALSGFADTHAAAATAAQLVAAGRVDVDAAGLAVFAAFASNAVAKVVLAFAAGGVRFGLRLLVGVAAMVGAFLAAMP